MTWRDHHGPFLLSLVALLAAYLAVHAATGLP